MTSHERLMTAFRKGTPDRAPMPLRMGSKFLGKYYSDVPSVLERNMRAHEEFGIDIFQAAPRPPLPAHSPEATPWRDDVDVEMKHEVRGNRNHWERTIHTPEGDLHDVKQALIITEGCG